MRRAFVIFLSMFYLVLSSGFTQYQHLCKGMATQLYSLTSPQEQNSNKPCPLCSSNDKDLTQKKKDCCKVESKTVKVDDSVKKQSNFDLSVKFWGDTIPNQMLGAVFDIATIEQTSTKNPNFSSKVPIRNNPLYILHCVYRI